MAAIPESITVSDNEYALPISDLLTGRGAVFGKSGSGKSNTASVLAEELLECGLPIVIIDIEGEYWGLTERYDIRYAGTTADADIAVSTENVDELVSMVLEDNEPLIVDISGITDADAIDVFLSTYVSRLFERENQLRKPCLLFVEEIHEFLPQTGRSGEFSDVLITVAKRGRKRGLGLCGLSQRPAAVDKEFITQCDWIVWHRLTWENDTKVVEKILGSDAAEPVTTLDNGEALVMTDWNEELTRVQFQRKQTFDAGSTPDLSVFETAELDSPSTIDSDARVASGAEPSASTKERRAGPNRGESETKIESKGISASTSTESVQHQLPPRTDEFDPLAEAALLTVYGGRCLRGILLTLLQRGDSSVRSGMTRIRSHPVHASIADADGLPVSDAAVRVGAVLGIVFGLVVIYGVLFG